MVVLTMTSDLLQGDVDGFRGCLASRVLQGSRDEVDRDLVAC